MLRDTANIEDPVHRSLRCGVSITNWFVTTQLRFNWNLFGHYFLSV